MIITDYHCHILPELDDGAENLQTALLMIQKMKFQGVRKIIATPHFYAHEEISVKEYLDKRQKSYDMLMNANPAVENIILGSEVAIESGLSEIEDVEKLAIQNTDYILLELPFGNYSRWITDEIYNISCRYKLKVIIAHIERYKDIYSKSQMAEILNMGVVLQVNNNAFKTFGSRQFVRKLIKEDYEVIFGSDCHNMTSRSPDWDIMRKYIKPEILKKSNNLIK